MSPTAVLLVGAGPGGPEHLTARAREALDAAQLVIHDGEVPEATLALAPGARLERAGEGERAALLEASRAGLRALRLFSGDPFVYGRGGPLARALHAAGARVEIVPGVSALSAATFAGVSLPPARFEAALHACESAPLHCVHAPGTPQQRVGSAPEGAALQVAGQRIPWFEARPLFGRRVGVTRAPAQQAALAEGLAALGAQVLAMPSIDFEPGEDLTPYVRGVGGYDWVIFTSVNGVTAFFATVGRLGLDARIFGGRRVACIGPSTAARLADFGLTADLVPPRFVAESLVESLRAEGVAGRRFLLPRAEVARALLPDTLRAEGGRVDVAVAYRTVAPPISPEVLDALRAGVVDLVTFTASSTVSRLCEVLEPAARARVRAACIGPVTRRAAEAHGLQVVVEAETFTIPGLIAALAEWGAAQPPR